jgi:hypothetical protein
MTAAVSPSDVQRRTGMREASPAVDLLETRHVRDALKAMPLKTNCEDARRIADSTQVGAVAIRRLFQQHFAEQPNGSTFIREFACDIGPAA